MKDLDVSWKGIGHHETGQGVRANKTWFWRTETERGAREGVQTGVTREDNHANDLSEGTVARRE